MRYGVVGDAFLDVVAPIRGQDLPAWGGDVPTRSAILPQSGGSALNCASHLASLLRGRADDDEVLFFGKVGRDAWANVLKMHASACGVDWKCVESNEESTGVCVVISSQVDDRCFVTDCGSTSSLLLSDFSESDLMSCDHLHIGGLFSCKELQRTICGHLVKLRSQNHKLTISLDTNFDASENWGWEEALGRSDDGGSNGVNWIHSELLPCVDYLLVNEVEAVGIAFPPSTRALLGSPEEAVCVLQRLLAPGGVAVASCGCEGAVAAKGGARYSCKSPNLGNAFKDSTGSGDAFDSGFLLSMHVTKGDVQASLSFACAAGASNCKVSS